MMGLEHYLIPREILFIQEIGIKAIEIIGKMMTECIIIFITK